MISSLKYHPFSLVSIGYTSNYASVILKSNHLLHAEGECGPKSLFSYVRYW